MKVGEDMQGINTTIGKIHLEAIDLPDGKYALRQGKACHVVRIRFDAESGERIVQSIPAGKFTQWFSDLSDDVRIELVEAEQHEATHV